MDYLGLIEQIFQVCIIPLLGILTTFLVTYLKTATEELKNKNDNETYKKYIDLLSETITDCVIATNQTYVESLKEQGKFDEEAQKEAFSQTCQAVLSILNDDAKVYLSNIFGDLEEYITQKIEDEVNINKGV